MGHVYKDVIDLITHDGLTRYKTKNSKGAIADQIQSMRSENSRGNKKGSVAIVKEKNHLATAEGVKGFPVTSKETLFDIANDVSHWTPNIYNTLNYIDARRTYIKGHAEDNLQQVNCFVIDCDAKEDVTVNDLLIHGLDESIGMPTLILETPKGFQLYYILEDPLFISNKNDFRGLFVAKTISSNLRKSYARGIKGVDLACNDFGFFRMPNQQNIRWFNPEYVYSMEQLINWSSKESDNEGVHLYPVRSIASFYNPLEQEWFQELVRLTNVKGKKGLIGRDNAIFTIALACFAAGKSKDAAFDLLDEFNSNLVYPVTLPQLKKSIKSAYSGKYKGASKDYVSHLLETWGSGLSSFGVQGWYKHAKPRQERERSHWYEWEQDVINFIQENIAANKPFYESTQKEISEAIGISRSMLNVVFKKSTKLYKKCFGKGRNSNSGFTTKAHLLLYLIQLKQTKTAFYKSIIKALDVRKFEMDSILLAVEKGLNTARGAPLDKQLTIHSSA